MFEFTTWQLVLLIVTSVTVGISATSLVFNTRLKQADGAVDYLDQLLAEAEFDKRQVVAYVAGLPINSRHWDEAQRIQYRQFAMLCKEWQAGPSYSVTP